MDGKSPRSYVSYVVFPRFFEAVYGTEYYSVKVSVVVVPMM